MKPSELVVTPLSELQEEFQGFVDSIREQEDLPEISQRNEAAANALAPYVGGPPQKRDRVALFMRRLESEAEYRRGEAKRLEASAKKMERLAEQMKFGIKTFMQMNDIVKAEGEVYTFALRKNPPSCKIVREEDLPPEFVEYKPTPNKQKILIALKEGKEVPGAVMVQSDRLEVK